MKVSEFFKLYILDHTSIDEIQYLSSEGLLLIHIQLVNWMQTFYEDGQLEFVNGKLVVSGVGSFTVDPLLNTLKFGEHADGEVISYGYVPERNQLDLEAGEIIMNWFDYQTRINTVVILGFLAKDVEWLPA